MLNIIGSETNILLYVTGGLLGSLILSLVLALASYFVFYTKTHGVSVIVAIMVAISFYVISYNGSITGFQFTQNVELLSVSSLMFTLGVDGLALVLLLLTLFIFPLCCYFFWTDVTMKKNRLLFMYLLVMEILLILTFSVNDLFYFYVFFESLLIPILIIIGVWGARERKIKANYLFVLYTLFGSLFILFGVLYLYMITGSTNFFVLMNIALEAEQQKIIWICFFMAFAIKTPLFPFHIWLPEAHVEAPTVGSMLLASLLLKLGGYGFLRFSLGILGEGSICYGSIVKMLALLGVLYGSLSTIRQIDMKRVIAYSSVAHINLGVLGLFSYDQLGVNGAIYIILAHGVVSTALFFCVGVLYDRYHSRLIRYYGGLVVIIPLFTFFFFAFTLANIGFPGTSNFLGELLLFVGIFTKNSAVLLLSTAGIVLSAVYSIWLFNRVSFGTLKTTFISRFQEISLLEGAILTILLFSILILGVNANFVLEYLSLIGTDTIENTR